MIKNFIVENNFKGVRLDIFVTENEANLTRSFVKTLIENGKIMVNGKKVKAGFSLRENDEVSIDLPEPEVVDILPENIPIKIVFQDDDLLVVDKAQGMVVHPAGKLKTGTLVNALLFCVKNLSTINGKIRPGIVHRIDKDTSGLLVVAKNDLSHKSLQKQIQEKVCERRYLAVVFGSFKENEGEIKNYLARGKNEHEKIFVVPANMGRYAETHYTVLKSEGGFSLVEFNLKTGRTHQIRVHSAYVGHSVVGDKKYGRKDDNFKLNGQLLHAYKLSFFHPKTNEKLEFESPLPDYFKTFLEEHNLTLT
ncbi:MAG: RluA family pseudouridine synthase [Clostridia bacterium]|nr:RluA family pseudouridine synthase [Clostridia bacterium]